MADKKAYARSVGKEAAKNGGRRDKAVRAVDQRIKKQQRKK